MAKVLLSDLKTRKDFPERWSQTPKGTLVHATTQENLPKILSEGLRPRGETLCQVWGRERIPYWVQRIEAQEEDEKRYEKVLGKIIRCRESGVYFWDDYQRGIEQAIHTVGYLKYGEPVLLVVDSRSLKLRKDPEKEEQPGEEEAVAYAVKGTIEKERIKCVCKLKEGMVPTSTGAVMCPIMHHEKEKCPQVTVETLYEALTDLSNWECECKE